MKNLLSLLLIAASLMIVSCSKDDGGSDDDGTTGCVTSDLTYTDDIKAILDTNCAVSGCHSENEATLQGSMHDYAAAKAYVDANMVEEALNHEEGVSPMPFPDGSDKLPDCTIDKIVAWIDAGAPE